MSTTSNFSYFQLSGDQSGRQKDEQSYQMRQYLQADPTVTECLAQSAAFIKGEKKNGTDGSGKEIKKRVADLEEVIQSGGSSTALA